MNVLCPCMQGCSMPLSIPIPTKIRLCCSPPEQAWLAPKGHYSRSCNVAHCKQVDIIIFSFQAGWPYYIPPKNPVEGILKETRKPACISQWGWNFILINVQIYFLSYIFEWVAINFIHLLPRSKLTKFQHLSLITSSVFVNVHLYAGYIFFIHHHSQLLNLSMTMFQDNHFLLGGGVKIPTYGLTQLFTLQYFCLRNSDILTLILIQYWISSNSSAAFNFSF